MLAAILLACLAQLIVAAATLILTFRLGPMHPFKLGIAAQLAALPMLAIAFWRLPAESRSRGPLEWSTLGWVVLFAVLQFVVGQSLFLTAIQRAAKNPGPVVMTALLFPAIITLATAAIRKQPPSIGFLAGFALMSLGFVVAVVSSRGN